MNEGRSTFNCQRCGAIVMWRSPYGWVQTTPSIYVPEVSAFMCRRPCYEVDPP